MRLTVEAIDTKIRQKLEIISQLIKLNQSSQNLKNELQELITAYDFSTMKIFTKEIKSEDMIEEYYSIINSENFVDRADKIFQLLTHNIEKSDKVNRQINRYLKTSIDTIKYVKENIKRCCCGATIDMKLVPKNSELQCQMCGLSIKLQGVCFEEGQVYTATGQKSNCKIYETIKHFKIWLKRIQGIENKKIDPNDRSLIEYYVNRDYPSEREKQFLNANTMRLLLKEDKRLTKYNDNISALIQHYTGRSPPQLSYDEERISINIFREVLAAYYVIHNEEGLDRINSIYLPYYILRILEHQFADDKSKLVILTYIHLQDTETVIYNDKIWEKICNCDNIKKIGITYKPTARFYDEIFFMSLYYKN